MVRFSNIALFPQDQIKELSKTLEASKRSEDEQRKAMQAMESTATKIETERLQQQAHEVCI